jgi:hypothetical protein
VTSTVTTMTHFMNDWLSVTGWTVILDRGLGLPVKLLRGGSAAILILCLVIAHRDSILGQAPSDRVWLAARYDRTRVVIYFEAARFHGTFPRNAGNIAAPEADVLFPPQAVSADSLASVQQKPGLERFAIGDRYDLVVDAGRVAAITLTTLVAVEGDEATGNDSYIGALGTVAVEDLHFFTQKYYAVSRHGAMQSAGLSRASGPATFAGLRSQPVPPTTKRQIVALIRARLKADASAQDVERFPPTVQRLQEFAISGGGRRYFASAIQRSRTACTAFSAWFARTPTLRVLTAGSQGCDLVHHIEPPRLLDALEIGDGRTGLVVDFPGFDGRSLQLLEYADGQDFDHMPTRWMVSAAE